MIQSVGKEGLRRWIVDGNIGPIEGLIGRSTVRNHRVIGYIFLNEVSVSP
jgi:hypothetical protein